MAKILKIRQTTYTGEALKKEQHFNDSSGGLHTQEMYIPSEDLVEAVNLAIQLKRPLLLMGEPGCGKTKLAESVAYELHGEKMHNHFFRWDIKSTTKAKDGIYRYDALKRLYHANSSLRIDKQKVKNHKNYIEQGKLADAFTSQVNIDKIGNIIPNILLIDEVDKADIDFPNDLLLELGNKTFTIPELGKKGELSATNDVIIFITSNQEKELPPAFLRRCLFHYIDFPEESILKRILKEHVTTVKDKIKTNLIKQAIEIFITVREDLADSEKKPSTSELVDWAKMLDKYTAFKEDEVAMKDASEVEKRLVKQLELLDDKQIPFKQILLKTVEARQKYSTNE